MHLRMLPLYDEPWICCHYFRYFALDAWDRPATYVTKKRVGKEGNLARVFILFLCLLLLQTSTTVNIIQNIPKPSGLSWIKSILQSLFVLDSATESVMPNTPSVYVELPPSRLFRLPSPTELFNTINSLGVHPSFLPVKYHKYYVISLDVLLSIAVVISYISLVLIANQTNRLRKNRPRAWCQTRIFRTVMLLHNSLLAVFSAAVFYLTLKVIYETFPSRHNQNYEVQVVDYFCKVGRPSWTTDGSEVTDHIRQHWSKDPWNNGLGALAWVFYLSKFYELLDTVLILMKGKEASFLQMFHRTGVLICLGAMIHSRNPLIVIGIVFNSGVHSIMVSANSISRKQWFVNNVSLAQYTYYTLTCLRFRVPGALKQTLTALQITQFVMGYILGFVYLFIHYDFPVSLKTPHGSSDITRLKPINSPQIILHQEDRVETTLANQYVTISCLTQSSHVFLLLLGGLLYLFPLTYLFSRFYFRTYRCREILGLKDSHFSCRK